MNITIHVKTPEGRQVFSFDEELPKVLNTAYVSNLHADIAKTFPKQTVFILISNA